jgi:hypothetical protein
MNYESFGSHSLNALQKTFLSAEGRRENFHVAAVTSSLSRLIDYRSFLFPLNDQ